MLAERGAAVVDADVVARTVMAPGGAAHAAVAGRFPQAVGPAGVIDRAALAAIVFSDAAARADLEALTHPVIRDEMAAEIAAVTATVGVIVVVVPLLVEAPAPRPVLHAVVVVDCPPEVALGRLVGRGMSAVDARARMATQATREARLARADHVVDNGGELERLPAEVDRCWAWMGHRAAAAGR